MSPITHELNLRTASNYIELRRTALVAGKELLVAAREIEHRAGELRMVLERRVGIQQQLGPRRREHQAVHAATSHNHQAT